jgi:hypothetical protein
MAYPIPTEHERRAVFAWLKQASSLTAWRRLYTFQQIFLDSVTTAYEEEQSTPGSATAIPTSWYARALQSQDAFWKALERLARGDRRCFAFLGAPGHFNEGLHSVEWWQDMYSGSFGGRNGFAPAGSPRWPLIERAMHDCLAALSDIGVVLQDRVIDNPAPVSAMDHYLTQPWGSLIKHWISQPSLPAVPAAPVPELLVPTGQVLPCYGIWEPVRIGHGAGRRTTAAGVPYDLADSRVVDGRTLDGAMNYLHGGFEAPTIEFEEDSSRNDGRPTTWRLVWRDDRYGDDPIPEEESRYVFVRPVPGEVLFTYG